MGRRKKLLIAVTNRSSYNKVKTIIRNLPWEVEPYLLLGNSVWLYKYGNAFEKIYSDFPDIGIYKVAMAVEGDDLIKMPKSVGVGSIEVATIIDNLKPDLMLTVADRYETLATATVAAYCNIPLIHLQGGEVSGTIDDKVRNTITQLADYHFPATYEAHRRIREMLCRSSVMPGDDVYHTEVDNDIWNMGCPAMDLMVGMKGMRDLMNLRREQPLPAIPADLRDTHTHVMTEAFKEVNAHGHGDIVTCTKPYIIVMIHPDTKYPITYEQVDNVMHMLDEIEYQKLIFWNNIDPGGEVIAKDLRKMEGMRWSSYSEARFLKHIEPVYFGALMYNCSLLFGNSSAGIREATFVGTPSISIGRRQQGREHGDNVRMVGWDFQKMRKTIKEILDKPIKPNYMYGDGNAGMNIAKKIGEIADVI